MQDLSSFSERISMAVPSARKPSLAQRIAGTIREAIVDARFDFGEALSEENLAQAFDVSRTPIREALNLLQVEGLVSVVPKSGTYIFTPTLEDIGQLCDYRAGLELQAARLVCAAGGGEGGGGAALAGRLHGICERMEAAAAAEDMRDYGRLDTEWHLALVTEAGNAYLENGYRMILGRVAALRTQLARRAEGEPERSMADHRRMAALIAAGDFDGLAPVLERHVAHTKTNYSNAFADAEARRSDGISALRERLKVR